MNYNFSRFIDISPPECDGSAFSPEELWYLARKVWLFFEKPSDKLANIFVKQDQMDLVYGIDRGQAANNELGFATTDYQAKASDILVHLHWLSTQASVFAEAAGKSKRTKH